MVTVRTLPPMPRPRNHDEILERVRRWSRQEYCKPNRLEDQRTIYSADAVGSRPVLEAIYEANLAIRRPNDYALGRTRFAKAEWALHNGCVSQFLVLAILEAKGFSLAKGHFRQLRSSLRVQELMQVRKTEAGYMHTELTRRGLEEIQAYVVPNQSRNEGSARHKAGVMRLYKALCAWTPLQLSVPGQVVNGYTPDLICTRLGEKKSLNLSNLLTSAKEVHFHVEVGGLTSPGHILRNIKRAHESDAEPIVVVVHDKPDRDALATMRHLHRLMHDRLHDIKAPWLSPGESDLMTQRGKRPVRFWIVTRDWYVWEYNRLEDRLVQVAEQYSNPTDEL